MLTAPLSTVLIFATPTLHCLDFGSKSVLWLNSVYHHQSQAAIKYSMRVTGVHKDSLDRHVMEKVQIQIFKGPVLMNRKKELWGLRIERTRY